MCPDSKGQEVEHYLYDGDNEVGILRKILILIISRLALDIANAIHFILPYQPNLLEHFVMNDNSNHTDDYVADFNNADKLGKGKELDTMRKSLNSE